MFKRVIFWSEFPEQADWKKAAKLIDFKTEIYVTVKTKKEFLNYKKKIKSKNIRLGAWPTLPKKDGYWFSGYTDVKSIDKLKEFKGINIKVDIEPPIPKGNYSKLKVLTWLLPYFLKKGKNNAYLKKTVEELSKEAKVIASGFPFPSFLLTRIGDDIEIKGNIRKNYIFYSTFFSRLEKPLMRIWYKLFAKDKIKRYDDKVMFALGCIGPGIFKTEPVYKDIQEFEKDLLEAEKIGIKNVVVFHIEGILGRKNPRDWINAIKKFTS